MKYLIPLLCLLAITSCKKDANSLEWLIPSDEVHDGGPGKDGIPSVDSPSFIPPASVDFLTDDDLVVGMVYNGEAKVYPHPILDWHEIVNDNIGDRNFALTYCPLTGTASAWDRELNGDITTFGVSGKLYNNNLIPYDRKTDSYWSQARLECVNGELIDQDIKTFPVIETTWGTWKQLYPFTKVMSTNTGFDRNYNVYPYGDYRTNDNNIIFPLEPSDDRLPAKDRVLALISESEQKAFPLNNFASPRIMYDQFDGRSVAVFGSKEHNFVVAYHVDAGQNFTLNLNNAENIAIDDDGNVLSISGLITSGPLAGTQLTQPETMMGYWFAFGAFYPDIQL